jgi:peroxiredoxin
MSRRVPGEVVAARELHDVHDRTLPMPAPAGLTHLQLRRFAGCPVCNLHLRSIAQRHGDIVRAGIEEVVVFHSPQDELRRHVDDAGLPFAVVADPDKRLYRELGAESRRRGLLTPRALWAIARGLARSTWAIIRGRERPPALVPHGGRFGLPAEFLLDPSGRIVACKYGSDIYDQWSVDELLAEAKSA